MRGDVATALTETVVLALISLIALVVFQRYEGTRRFAAAAMKGATTRRRAPIKSGKARLVATLSGVIFTIMLALPVATLVLVSFARDGAWTTQALPTAYTLDNYARILTQPQASSVFINS